MKAVIFAYVKEVVFALICMLVNTTVSLTVVLSAGLQNLGNFMKFLEGLGLDTINILLVIFRSRPNLNLNLNTIYT